MEGPSSTFRRRDPLDSSDTLFRIYVTTHPRVVLPGRLSSRGFHFQDGYTSLKGQSKNHGIRIGTRPSLSSGLRAPFGDLCSLSLVFVDLLSWDFVYDRYHLLLLYFR